MIMEAWEAQNLQVGWQTQRPRDRLQFKSKGDLLVEFLLAYGDQPLSLN